ncbi:helix-turn-helix transcriptional regulator [Halobacillus rhizosphaerae]|uniref:helix-turn-helix transcriptional regulator n=1 Tax=Halobacillus rhizosphaerae TaxID=3064889 RepID=UPI00398AC95F
MKNHIKTLREDLGVSQGKLADLCNVSRQTINAIENNKYDPTLKLAFNIAKHLGATVDKVFTP